MVVTIEQIEKEWLNAGIAPATEQELADALANAPEGDLTALTAALSKLAEVLEGVGL